MAHLLDDVWLQPYERAVRGRAQHAFARAQEWAGGTDDAALLGWATAHDYFGLHAVGRRKWVFREWAPHATAIWLVGDFSDWKKLPQFRLTRRDVSSGVWECTLPYAALRHGQNYALQVEWEGGGGLRIPSCARYVVQDAKTNLFCAQVWHPPRVYRWKHDACESASQTPLIYEAHVGMATEEPRVGTYREFRDNILPRIKAAGYNTVQLMAVMEHPYYGSFGYHVSSFFAPSSRFGTPDELKSLVDTAHGMGLRVIMDIVHSHAVKNEAEGLSCFDGTDYQYFHHGDKGHHLAWDSRCFDYGKREVVRFLLSNCRYWLDEFHFDGYRFDGVTSMLYAHHGLGVDFTDYGKYFDGSLDDEAWVYLQLANRVIHATKPTAITIAEDVSGLPGCAAPVGDCGLGFDYRMAMGEPDYWFRLVDKVRDEDWSMHGLYHELTNRRAEERVVSYVESHDQALVGGKTFFFQMADAEIYWGMANDQHAPAIERALALHKMARLATCALNGGAYLNFMGNEFGHPEWVDFPRAENGWSYAHARRQWSLRDDPNLRFRCLADFDAAMLAELTRAKALFVGHARAATPTKLVAHDGDKVLAFLRGELLFVFNFNPSRSFVDYGILVPPASDWQHLFDTDEPRFGGQGRIAPHMTYAPNLVFDGAHQEIVQQIRLYLPARTAIVLKRV